VSLGQSPGHVSRHIRAVPLGPALGGPCRALRGLRLQPHRLHTRVATVIAQSVRARRRRIGSRPARADLLPAAIFTWSSRAGSRSLPSPTRTRRWSTTCCFARLAETLLTIAADPRHLGARHRAATCRASQLGLGNDPSPACPHDRARWLRDIARRDRAGCAASPRFLLPVRVLSRLFRRLFIWRLLADAHVAGRLAFFGEIRGLAAPRRPSTPISHRLNGRSGSSTPGRPSPGREYSRSPYLAPPTPIASPSRTVVSLLSDEPA